MAVDVQAFLKWFISFQNPLEIWQNHPTYLLCEIIFLLMALNTFRHAVRNGGCYLILWIGLLLHGLTTECVSYFVPDIDNFWHGQTTIMLIGKRLPLHIFLFYPATMYTAALAVSRLRLPFYAEPFATGLADVMIDFPFDIMGIKLVWWTWHDTDPNIFDRHYWVPWTSYIFHMTFMFSFTFIFHGTRRLLIGVEKFQSSKSWFREIICALVAGMFSMPLAVVQFILFYHIPHDLYGIHTEVVVCAMAMVYGLIAWSADRNPSIHSREENSMTTTAGRKQKEGQAKKKKHFDEISMNIILHYTFYILLVIFAHPEKIRSTGLNQPVGNCSHETAVQSPIGLVLYKKTYLCPTNYDEGYFDWHCNPNGHAPPDGSTWYTVCGNAYPNHAEYVFVVTAFCVLGLFVYFQMLYRSSSDLPHRKAKVKSN